MINGAQSNRPRPAAKIARAKSGSFRVIVAGLVSHIKLCVAGLVSPIKIPVAGLVLPLVAGLVVAGLVVGELACRRPDMSPS